MTTEPDPPTREELAALAAQTLLANADKVRALLGAAGAAREAVDQLLANAETKAAEEENTGG